VFPLVKGGVNTPTAKLACGALATPPLFFMGTFSIKCKIENLINRKKSVVILKMLVNTGSEYTLVSTKYLEEIGIERGKKDLEFVMANGQRITRSVGFAIIRLDKFFTVDEVVFAEKGDLLLLGARTLEGLSLAVDPRKKKLVASVPIPAA
jgi:predicted aspartyl protease